MIAILKIALVVIYSPLKLFKTKNKIVYLSRQSNEKSLDMVMLESKIKELSPNVHQVFRLKMIDKGLYSKISYCFTIIGDMYHIATAKVAICDTYSIPISCLKHKESLKVIQIWHALAAIKKFGLQSVGLNDGRDEKLSNAMCMHKNYDFVIAPSKATAMFFAEAFGVENSKIKICPLPRVDYILDESNRRDLEFYSKNPELSLKKIVLYLPTFRDREAYIAEELKVALEDFEDIKLIISPHPLSNVKVQEKFKVQGDYSIYDLMKISDVIISDYSATAVEASLLMKPLYFFAPDFDLYCEERGLNVLINEEMKNAFYKDANELATAINSSDYDFNELFAFLNKYVENKGKDNTTVLAKFITQLL